MSEQKWIPKDRDWSEYPNGTKARSNSGEYWEKKEDGWIWRGNSVFMGTPGGEATGYIQLPEEPEPIRDVIFNHIEGLVSNFLYYDRKESEDLPMDAIENAVLEGVITVDEMVEAFRNHLNNHFDGEV